MLPQLPLRPRCWPGRRDWVALEVQCGLGGIRVSHSTGSVTLRHNSRLHHIGLGARLRGTHGHPELMKPHPSSIERSLDFLPWPASQCVLIGDSVTDINVSHTTGVRSIGFAKHPARGRELHLAQADAVTHSIADLADQVRNAGNHPRARLSGPYIAESGSN